MIVYENEYRHFFANNNGRGDNVPGRTINSYVSKLNGISEKIRKSISPQFFNRFINLMDENGMIVRKNETKNEFYDKNISGAFGDCGRRKMFCTKATR